MAEQAAGRRSAWLAANGVQWLDRPMDPNHLHLAELLDFRPDRGLIRLHEQRVVILSAAAMGLLRKELTSTFGLATARRLLMRFGYADGCHDAVSLRDQSRWKDPIEGLRAGATLHTLEGIVHAALTDVEYDRASGAFSAGVEWRSSYEAEQHMHHYGRSEAPVCWSLVGYISGYASACLGHELYFQETSCAGQGASHCTVIGRDAQSWGPALEGLRFDFQGADHGELSVWRRSALRSWGTAKETSSNGRSRGVHGDRAGYCPPPSPPNRPNISTQIRRTRRAPGPNADQTAAAGRRCSRRRQECARDPPSDRLPWRSRQNARARACVTSATDERPGAWPALREWPSVGAPSSPVFERFAASS